MASVTLYLDTRHVKTGPASLKWMFTQSSRNALLPTGIKLAPYQWDAVKRQVTRRHPDRDLLNQTLAARMAQINLVLMEWEARGYTRSMTATDIRRNLEPLLPPIILPDEEAVATLNFSPLTIANPLMPAPVSDGMGRKTPFLRWYDRFAATKSDRTAEVYEHTRRRLLAYLGEKKLRALAFEDITPMWLRDFDAFMAQTAPSANARAIHMRNIRTVFNAAIAEDDITCYPFRKYQIKTERTRKRSLSIDALRQLFDYPCDEYTAYYRDIFKLMFFFIGINLVDLCNLKTVSREGRIEYKRAKTGREYSIKVEPEAAELLERLKGKDYLIDPLDRYNNHRDFNQHINDALKKIGPVTRSGRGGRKEVKPLFPELSTYWSRHTWATIAASLDIPKETIAAALGHGRTSVTDIYIDFDQTKVDVANRRVIDWVLYGKR